MRLIASIVCAMLILSHAVVAQSRAAETRPLRAEAIMASDPIESRMARLEKAAQRYLDLANASTDPKGAAEYMRLYEEKERAVGELVKEAQAERKDRELLAGLRGWRSIAEDAFRRAYEAAGSPGQPKQTTQIAIESELTNAREAEAKAVALQASRTLGPAAEPDAASSMNVLRERIRKIEALLFDFQKRLTATESRPR